MCGNDFGRFCGPSVKNMFDERDEKAASYLDNQGSYSTVDMPPYACLDTVPFIYGDSATIDLLGNDHDVNGDSISLSSYDSTSTEGGSITLSSGTGPSGRDELIYTGPTNSILCRKDE